MVITRRIASISIRIDSSSEMFGTRLMPGTSEPSFISGMKAVPSSGSSDSEAASATTEARIVVRALATARRSSARYGLLSTRISQVSWASSSCAAP